jgi:hypothetical protein
MHLLAPVAMAFFFTASRSSPCPTSPQYAMISAPP